MIQETFSPNMPPHAFPQYPPNIPLLPNAMNGHQIPMLSDKKASPNTDDFLYQQPPLQPIPPGPQATLPQKGGIDWEIIASSSPEQIAETNDIETLTAIIQSFIHAKFTQTEAQLMPNPLTSKFFRILQIAIQYLLDCQAELKESLEESEKSEQLLQAKLKNLSLSLQKAKENVKKSQIIKDSTEKCIVCGRRFKTIKYLDGHVQRRHGGLMPAWRSLRTGELQGMSDVSDQIEMLRQEVAKAHRELEKRAEQEAQKAPITHIVSHSDEQILLLKQLINKQDEMMSQARELEEKQLGFRKEMRNQLDDAIMALQESQRQLDVQATRISQIPLVPQPDTKPIKPDDLEASLTEQLVKPTLDKKKISNALDHLFSDIGPSPFETEVRPKPTIPVEPSPIAPTEDESKTKVEGEKSDSKVRGEEGSESDQRDKKHQELINKLHDEEEAEEDEFVMKPSKRKLSKREQIEELLRRGKVLLNHKINPDEVANRDVTIAAITDGTLHQVNVKLAELKRKRPYAALSPNFVAKQMKEETKQYKQTYLKLSEFVGTQVPSITEEFKKNLFKERNTKFPLLPPIRKLTQQQLLRQRKRKGKKGQDEDHHGIPKIPDELLDEAGKKFKFNQRMHRNRPRLLPGDSEVEVVEKFSSETSSDRSVGYREDPDYYKRFDKEEKVGFEKEFENIHLSSASSSSTIEPLQDSDGDTKVFNIDEFDDSSEDDKSKNKPIRNIFKKDKNKDKDKDKDKNKDKDKDKNKNKDKKKQDIKESGKNKKNSKIEFNNDDDSDEIIDISTVLSANKSKNKSKSSKDDFNFEEEEEYVDSFSNSTQEIPLKEFTKTKTMKLQTAGSGDFDVTKKQSTKGATGSDDLFNLSDFSSGDEISPDEEEVIKKTSSKTKK